MNANKDENADLWWALKGGSNNFGIVTRMDMSTFPLPNGVWGGKIDTEYSPTLQRQTIEAYYKFQTERLAEDPGVESLSGWGKQGAKRFIQNVLSADRAVPYGGHPKAFDDFFALKPDGWVGNCKPSQLAAHDAVIEGAPKNLYFCEATRYVPDKLLEKSCAYIMKDHYAVPDRQDRSRLLS